MLCPSVAFDGKHLPVHSSRCIIDTPSEENLDRLARLAQRLFRAPYVLITATDFDRPWLNDIDSQHANQIRQEMFTATHMVGDDEPAVITDITADARFANSAAALARIRFYAGYPLASQAGYRIGTLSIADCIPRTIGDDEFDLLCDFGRMVEQTIATAELTNIDALTGIANRRGFTLLADKLLRSCRRIGRNIALMEFDLDRFKRVNDTLGHDQGDLALQDFAHCLQLTFRDCDVIGRLGGDEFWALLTGVPPARLPTLLSRLRQLTTRRCRQHQRRFRIDYSVGSLCVYPTHANALPELMQRTDAAMYRNKHKIRNTDSVEVR